MMVSCRLLVVVMGSVFSSAAHADIIFVDVDNCPGPGSGSETDPFCAVQDAIDVAAAMDEIIVAPGIYFETINFLGKAITLRGPGGPNVTIIDAQGVGSVVTCDSGEGPGTVLSGFTITGGSASQGGGMFNFESSPMVISCRFEGNAAEGGGGGMYSFAGNPAVTNCAFIGNSAGSGAGVFAERVVGMALTNCTIGDNASAVDGGGVQIVTHAGVSSDLVLSNCILWGNSPEQVFEIFWGQDSESTTTVRHSNVQDGWAGSGGNNISAGPGFVDPANGDYRLAPGSPCIDAGDNTAVPVEITTDLDGNLRFVDDPATPDCGHAPGECGIPPVVDMGAHELQPCPADLNGNESVEVVDLLILIASFGPCNGCPGDFDVNGFVNILDLLSLISAWGSCPGTPCVWDVNGDAVVDQTDLHQVRDNMGPCDGCPEDVNGDGVVNGQDMSAVTMHFGPCP
ncbi:MAG: dockerin type I domain-containing protein [Planctomycetota bacterium]|jgi:hypothetical protein